MEISKKSKLSHTSVKLLLEKLKKQKIITETQEKKGKRKYPLFNSNVESNQYKIYKQIFNILEIQKSDLIELIQEELMPASIVLFGSYLRGEDIEGSDIDLFVGCKSSKINVSKFEKIFQRKIELHFSERFKDYPKELKNNIINGFVLRGHLE